MKHHEILNVFITLNMMTIGRTFCVYINGIVKFNNYLSMLIYVCLVCIVSIYQFVLRCTMLCHTYNKKKYYSYWIQIPKKYLFLLEYVFYIILIHVLWWLVQRRFQSFFFLHFIIYMQHKNVFQIENVCLQQRKLHFHLKLFHFGGCCCYCCCHSMQNS